MKIAWQTDAYRLGANRQILTELLLEAQNSKATEPTNSGRYAPSVIHVFEVFAGDGRRNELAQIKTRWFHRSCSAG